jgi:hypothetical protein
MSYNLFIDDERWPADATHWNVIARSPQDVKDIFERMGVPSEISFDHDLGLDMDDDGNEYEMTGMQIVRWMIECHLDGVYDLSTILRVYVHSMNPVGARAIQSTLRGFFDCELHNPAPVTLQKTF